ncbi:MAG: hypothetical protein U1F77_17020 [Kiritimatiellia bacterium]
MKRWLPPVLAVLATAGLLVFQWRLQSPARHVGDIAHGVRCLSCQTNYTLTTDQMNDLIDRGDAVSPPEQVRRFKCRGCGKMEATLDLSTYFNLRDGTEKAP